MIDFFRPELEEDCLFHVGVSGGKDSTAVLLWMIHESGVPPEMIDATFADTGNEHEWTYEHIEWLSENVHPVTTLKPVRPFYELAAHKMRFPSSQRRFCTEHLKIKPTFAHITKLLATHARVVAVSGVRADESDSRKSALEWDYSGRLLTLQWRPIIRWTFRPIRCHCASVVSQCSASRNRR